MPTFALILSQGVTRLVVTSDAPWDEVTLPELTTWLHRHGLESVTHPPPAWPPRA